MRDYIHVDDLASAHLLALEGARAGQHRIFNLGNGNGFSVREVIAATEKVVGAAVPTMEARDVPVTRRCWSRRAEDPLGARMGADASRRWRR